MFKCWTCCVKPRTRHHRLYDCSNDDDYILPEGDIQWDKSQKTFISTRSTKRRDIGSYIPPKVPNRMLPAGLPVIEEFKLLKTVGKGAFGKVSYE